MLIIADRGFYSFQLWAEFMATGADLLFRVASGLKLPVLETLPDGSYLSVVNSKSTRSSGFQIPLSAVGDPRHATHIPVRVIEYTVTDSTASREPEVFRLITTILDPDDLAAAELAAAYHERWEYEISLKEIETQMLDLAVGSAPSLPRWYGGDVGPAAGPLRRTCPDGRGCGISWPGSRPAVIHPKYQRRPPPGH